MTARRLQRIGVVGAGMAGLACALAAARSGRQVTLLEAAPQPPQLPGSVDVLPAMLRDLVGLVLPLTQTRVYSVARRRFSDEHRGRRAKRPGPNGNRACMQALVG